jgi:hypothetical protein
MALKQFLLSIIFFVAGWVVLGAVLLCGRQAHAGRDAAAGQTVFAAHIAEECCLIRTPAERRALVPRAPRILGHRSGRDVEAEPGQLRLDPSLAPQVVFGSHTLDENLKLRGNWAAVTYPRPF